MYDPGLGRWLEQDPSGFDAGDTNLYRYVGNAPTVFTDPSGLQQRPGSRTVNLGEDASAFVEWNPESGWAEISVRNRQGEEVGRYRWQRTNPDEIVSVSTHRGRTVPGISDSLMRRISLSLNNQLKIMVERAGGSWRRSMTPAGVRGGFPANAIMAYGTIREACQMAGVGCPDYQSIDAPYFFTAEDGSVFVIQTPSTGRRILETVWSGIVGAVTLGQVETGRTSPQRVYVAGPRRGQTENITDADVDAYREAAEALYGRLVLGGLFREPRFIPGSERDRLPLIERDIYGNSRVVGYIDATGVHRVPEHELGMHGLFGGA